LIRDIFLFFFRFSLSSNPGVIFLFSADFGTGKPMSRKPRLLLLAVSTFSFWGVRLPLERPESGKWTFCFFWCSWLSFFFLVCFYDPLWRGFSWSWRSTGSTLSAGQRLGRFRCFRPADSS
jgi:hypothetical protein